MLAKKFQIKHKTGPVLWVCIGQASVEDPCTQQIFLKKNHLQRQSILKSNQMLAIVIICWRIWFLCIWGGVTQEDLHFKLAFVVSKFMVVWYIG